MVQPVPDGADSVAVIGENRKMLVFPLAELPELGRGQGVQLQRYRDGGLSRRDGVRAGRRDQLAAGRRKRAGAVGNRPDAVARDPRRERADCRPTASRGRNRFEPVPPVAKAATKSTNLRLTGNRSKRAH